MWIDEKLLFTIFCFYPQKLCKKISTQKLEVFHEVSADKESVSTFILWCKNAK
jgi:hypothetical protein